MHAGRDARKRNRNIGTPKRGHGQDNRLVIPRGIHDDRVFWSKLSHPVAVVREVGTCSLTFLVEPTFPDFVHACTIDDLCFILERAPQEHLRQIQLVILRQPKRKENILSPVWGRFLYYADTGRHFGTAICLEAQDPRESSRWKRSLSVDDQDELARLKEDGHRIAATKRTMIVHRSLESIRATQLYRTVLHELGHCADWLIHCVNPALAASDDAEGERIHKEFDGKPAREREAFANRYARELRSTLEQMGRIPFERIVNPHSLSRDGLTREWFGKM